MYQLQDESLVSAIASDLCEPIPKQPLEERLTKSEECAKKKVPEGLRTLVRDHKPPFHYVGFKARLGVPGEEDRPAIGRANVCKEGGLLDKTLEVINKSSGRTIQVKATGSYTCTGFSKFPDLQLSAEDAEKLFGYKVVKPEGVVVVELN